jgi:peroxiredoxin
LGPAVGEHFPVPLAARDQNGKQQTLDSLMGDKGLALVFQRSADWCPFCQAQLEKMNKHLAQFRAAGLNVASVTVDSVAKIAAFAKQAKIGYTMLSDPKAKLIEKLGIRDKQYPVGSFAYGVPRPVLYIIDTSGKIRARYMPPTYQQQPDVDKVLHDVAAMKL